MNDLSAEYGPLYMQVHLAVSAFALVFGVFRLSYQKVVGTPLPRNKVVMFLEVIVEMSTNLIGQISKGRELTGGAPLFTSQGPYRSQTLTPPEPPKKPTTPPPTVMSLMILGGIGFVGVLGIGATCSPKLPPVAGCARGEFSCINGTPSVCSATGRWYSVGDVSCSAVGATCAISDAGVAYCARAGIDGGTPDAN